MGEAPFPPHPSPGGSQLNTMVGADGHSSLELGVIQARELLPGLKVRAGPPGATASSIKGYRLCIRICVNENCGLGMAQYLGHIADGVLQVQLMENVQNTITGLLSRSPHEDLAEEFSVKIGPPGSKPKGLR